MMFTTLSNNVTAGVRNITVKPKWDTGSTAGSTGGGNWLPKGHYLTFANERNLKTEMLDLIDSPYRAQSNWHLGIARDMHAALKTPGVKGVGMLVDWRTLETGDGRYNWQLLDANMAAARRLGLKFIVQVATRSFDGNNILPAYFPSQYVVWYNGGGKTGVVAKLWDSYVYSRLIRLNKQIARRYASNPAFGGIATSETALGNLSGGNYSYWKYRAAQIKIATETQSALQRGRFFWYLNFMPGGDSRDMRRDARVGMVNSVPHHALVIGAPDITPDKRGFPGSLSGYRIHMRKTKPNVQQFCHLQHVDLGLGGTNRKSNQYRQEFLAHVRRVRSREQQSWFSGPTRIFQFDDLRPSQGSPVDMHPNWVLGDLWKPIELFSYANRNYDCDYVMWHYRENVHNLSGQFWWEDIRPVILNNQNFFQ
jgi:hypothetical protein